MILVSEELSGMNEYLSKTFESKAKTFLPLEQVEILLEAAKLAVEGHSP